jgi:hypothetical protein
MNMTNEQNAIDYLQRVYKAYYLVSKSKNAPMDADKYAKTSTADYVEYIRSCQENHPHWETVTVINNQIRILLGLIECYDRPNFKVKPKTSNKTRWSL